MWLLLWVVVVAVDMVGVWRWWWLMWFLVVLLLVVVVLIDVVGGGYAVVCSGGGSLAFSFHFGFVSLFLPFVFP